MLFRLYLCSMLCCSVLPCNGQDLEFNILNTDPVVGSLTPEQVNFSILDAEETIGGFSSDTGQVNEIPFSILDIDEEQFAARIPANRVLVFVRRNLVTTQQVKVCVNGFCRYEMRQVKAPAEVDNQLVQQLKELKSGWKTSEDTLEPCHFLLVYDDSTEGQKTFEKYSVESTECPILVKELDPETRISFGDSGRRVGTSSAVYSPSGTSAATWYVNHYDESLKRSGSVNIEDSSTVEITEPTAFHFESSDRQWTYPGSIRKHLTDPKQVHHLPPALVATWTDEECIAWHNWHHETLSGR